ncbi:AraC family transcriptional regulator [Paracoccus sp. IB05]|uniref:helix-turn-helix transcriptional regulator n=1 Tax=Paracoccus sp. IB05 TaxID=2779367 RepID=UPI001E2E4799|nr:AraC family transcriptional regulator [Paracoccus sp. IB05]
MNAHRAAESRAVTDLAGRAGPVADPARASPSRIEPARFLPGEGETTRIALPGVAGAMQVDLLRLGPGLSVAFSRFAAGSGMEDQVRWPPGRLLMTFNIAGSMAIRDAEGVAHAIRNGEGWVLHTGSGPLARILHPGQSCSNLVVVMESEAVSPRLRALILRELPQQGMVRTFRLSRLARHLPGSFFDGNASPAALLRKEGDCLTLIGQVFEELEIQGKTEPLPEARILVQRTEALLRDRLSETLSLDDLALTLGVSHVTLNRTFRRETGMTVFERLRDIRLEHASDLIRRERRSLTEIAYECGFSSPGHLSTAFRKRFGMTARSWRQRGPIPN